MRHPQSILDFVAIPPANDVALPALPDSAHRKLAPAVIHRIPADWRLSAALLSEAKAAGVLTPDTHLERLKAGPVGGARGLFADQLEAYVRSMFGRWRTWEETDRAKAQLQVTGGAKGGPVPPELPSAERMKGWPAWVRKSVAVQVKAEGRDIAALAKNFALTHHIPPNSLDVRIAAEAFEQYLERARKEAA